MSSPYEFVPYNRLDYSVICTFCGAVVAETMKDDHINWHETLDLQATAVMRRSLLEIEDGLDP